MIMIGSQSKSNREAGCWQTPNKPRSVCIGPSAAFLLATGFACFTSPRHKCSTLHYQHCTSHHEAPQTFPDSNHQTYYQINCTSSNRYIGHLCVQTSALCLCQKWNVYRIGRESRKLCHPRQKSNVKLCNFYVWPLSIDNRSQRQVLLGEFE